MISVLPLPLSGFDPSPGRLEYASRSQQALMNIFLLYPFEYIYLSNSMRLELVFLGTVDSSLGRVGHDSFSQQTLMEMVIEGITNKERVCGNPDQPKDIEE
ncbi:hypothetical protein XU18_1683 [Perkinsela sp. CCAP 1560/4]|nr:hypothetical protein XU18_1683 [Perkinsela sp. CCAP 1560/4]|eukprot:KNH07682.1 hypothetical protein XU18_1683 [Perkinsela sp. CCAP 1560/4]